MQRPPGSLSAPRNALRLLLLAVVLTIGGTAAPSAGAATLPAGFQESTVFSGLTNPTVVRFASDGRVFVATKSGRIYVYNSITDPTRTLFADLSGEVQDYWDRGMLGMALDPQFPSRPYVYVLYTYDHVLGDPSSPPKWGDQCPTPPGPTTDGCVVSGRLSRLTAAGSTMTGSEQVLIEDWCQQFPSHSIGSLNFAPDGTLYVTGGDGASFNYADYGQTGNPCGDPGGPAGSNLSPPTAEGGALRSQDVRTGADPTSLNGAVLRVDPNTGQGVTGNPYAGSTDANARRIVALGLRNPFRATLRPGTNELWIGDVGWSTWEEIDRMSAPGAGSNFGWPCYEGASRQGSYDAANLNLCESLYAAGSGAVVAPWFTYNHASTVVPTGDPCPTGGSAIAGLAFGTSATTYPAPFGGALFFTDHSRNCIWAMPLGTNGLPDPAAVRSFDSGLTTGPVDLVIGPGGDLYYPGFDSGTIQRISYAAANRAPTAVATATPTSGNAPLTVQFDGTGSSDPDPGDTLSYAWDLDGNGAFNDSTAARPTWTYQTSGVYTPRLRVTDNHGASGTSSVTITVGNTPPTATIAAPTSSLQWAVGDVIGFRGSATDAQDGTLAPSSLSWQLILHHCPSDCHEHVIQSFSGASGSFTAPDHEYPSYLELRLTATDSGGLTNTQSVRLDPRTVSLTLASIPGNGIYLTLNSVTAQAKFSRTVIQNSSNSISAPDPTTGRQYNQGYLFRSWSDGGAQTHQVRATASATYTATFRKR
jgi:glucose/arabinose dehydrogenase/PKD repeat protein